MDAIARNLSSTREFRNHSTCNKGGADSCCGDDRKRDDRTAHCRENVGIVADAVKKELGKVRIEDVGEREKEGWTQKRHRWCFIYGGMLDLLSAVSSKRSA